MSKIILMVLILAIGFSCTKAQLNSSDIAVKNSGRDNKIPLTNSANSTTNLNLTSSNPEDIAKENPTDTLNSTTPQPERTNETSTTKFEEKKVSEDHGSPVLSNFSTTTDSNLNTTNIDLNMTNIHQKDNSNASTTEKVDGSRKTSSAKPNTTSSIGPKEVDGKEVDAATPEEIDIRTHSFTYWIILVLSLGLLMVGFIILFALRTMRKSNQAERVTELSAVGSLNTWSAE